MDYDDLFKAYYTQYRVEAEIPTSADDEYKIGLVLANEAINRWANYDNTFWKELYQTAQLEADGDLVITTGTMQYATPSNMRIAGGFIRLFDANNVTRVRLPILEPQDAQFRTDKQNFAYFIGNPNTGFTLVLNPTPIDSWVGLHIDYVYYKKPTLFVGGTDLTEMSQPYFIVHRMLASRFRGSRNPYYSSAKGDAEDVLTTMKMENNSGNWSDPWKMADNSGSQWGK